MMQEALDMGDEAHNRNNALASMVSCVIVGLQTLTIVALV
jgi:hypothetical protein